MPHNALIIGAGYFSQRIHIQALKKNKYVNKIFIYDERKILCQKVAKKFNLIQLNSFELDQIKKNDIKIAILCFVRELSYLYALKSLKMDLHLLAEKPVVNKYKNLKKLILVAQKRNKIFQICYQKTFSPAIIFLKKNLEKFEKKYGKAKTVVFELFNGDMRNGTRSFCRTAESIIYKNRQIEDFQEFTKKNNEINYKIFMNRYIHSINLFSHIFNYSNIKLNRLKILSKYNYTFEIQNKNTSFFFIFGEYSYNKWHDKITIFFEKCKLSLNLNAPLDFKPPTIFLYDGFLKLKKKINLKNTNIFVDQLNHFISSINVKKNNNFDNYINDYKICKNLWEK